MDQPLFVTFRLHGSLPPGRHFPKESMTSGKAFVCVDRLLDNRRAGPLYFQMPHIARLVVDSIQQMGHADCVLHSWVIMPNHVHVLLTPKVDVAKFMHKLKGATARQANKLLCRTGMPFWQDESYDHLVRNSEEFQRIENYILQNPIKAGLAASTEEYPWSSMGQAPLLGHVVSPGGAGFSMRGTSVPLTT